MCRGDVMDVTFQLREVTSNLLHKKQDEAFWHQFADNKSAARSVRIREGSLEVLADGLELDADGMAFDLERYVQGKYRSKAKGPGGNRLGDFGECLTYLLCLRAGQHPVRVVRRRAGNKRDTGSPSPTLCSEKDQALWPLK